MRYVSITLAEPQVTLLAGAAGNAMIEAEDDAEREQLAGLTDFLYAVEGNPAAFPVAPKMARTIKKRFVQLKGPAQPGRKPNQRKRAQLRSQSGQKRTRAQNRVIVAEFNAAREAYEAAVAAREAQAEDKPKSKLFRVPSRRNRSQ